MIGSGDQEHPAPPPRVGLGGHGLQLPLGDLDRLRQRDDRRAGHPVLLERGHRFALEVQRTDAQVEELLHAHRHRLARDHHDGRAALAEQRGGQGLAGRRASGHHHDGVGGAVRRLDHEDPAGRAQQGPVCEDRDEGQHQQGDQDDDPRPPHARGGPSKNFGGLSHGR